MNVSYFEFPFVIGITYFLFFGLMNMAIFSLNLISNGQGYFQY